MTVVIQTWELHDIVTQSLINTVYLTNHAHNHNHVFHDLLNRGLVKSPYNSMTSLFSGISVSYLSDFLVFPPSQQKEIMGSETFISHQQLKCPPDPTTPVLELQEVLHCSCIGYSPPWGWNHFLGWLSSLWRVCRWPWELAGEKKRCHQCSVGVEIRYRRLILVI